MPARRIAEEPAYVLHRYDWSESSLILDVFTRHYGRVALVAKGAKKPTSNFRPVLLPLQPLRVGYTVTAEGLGEVHPLKGAEWVGGHDHVPCVVKIDTKIPKSPIFRFENFWVEAQGFFEVVQQVWMLDPGFHDPAKYISYKLKILRKKLKLWSKNLSRIVLLLSNSNKVIDFIDLLEEERCISLIEWNFREVVKHCILKLLEFRKIYWKKRCTNRWMMLGEENTKSFQSIATERYRINTVSQILNQNG